MDWTCRFLHQLLEFLALIPSIVNDYARETFPLNARLTRTFSDMPIRAIDDMPMQIIQRVDVNSVRQAYTVCVLSACAVSTVGVGGLDAARPGAVTGW